LVSFYFFQCAPDFCPNNSLKCMKSIINSPLNDCNYDLLIVYLGKVLPMAQVGYIGFAQKWAFTPLRLVMDNVIRITFPSFSRLQDEKDVLKKAVEKSIFAASFLIFPSLFGLVILSPYFVNFIPKYLKWEPAILSLGFFSINAALSSVSTPLTNALNAIGKIKVTLYLMVFWTISTWVLTPIFIKMFGFNGVSMASAIIACSVVLVIYLVRRYIRFDVLKVTAYPFLGSVTMAIFIYFLSPIFVKGLASLIFMILLGAVLYFFTMFLLSRKEILSDFALIKSNLKK